MIKKISYIVLASILLVSCNSDDNEIVIPPSVVTLDSKDINSGGIELFGDFQNFNSENTIGFIVYDNANHYQDIKIQEPIVGKNSISITSGLFLNRTYFYKSYIKTANEIYLGKVESFISNGSSLISFDSIVPNKGNYGDQIEILADANLLSESNSVKVYFDGLESQIVGIVGNKISCIIPYFRENYVANITINYFGKPLATNLNFELLAPIINEISPKEITYNDEVVIFGDNFENQNYQSLKVFVDGYETTILDKSRTEIKIRIPNDITNQNPKVKIISNLQEVEQDNLIQLKAPVITSYSSSAYINDRMIIIGENFNPSTHKNEVYFGKERAKVYAINNTNKIDVVIPSGVYTNRNPSITIKIAGDLVSSSYPFSILDKSFAVNKEVDTGIHGFQVYDGITQTFSFKDNKLVTEKFDSDINEFYGKKSFDLPQQNYPDVINTQDGYIYMYYQRDSNNFYKINLNTGDTQQLADFPGVKRTEVLKSIGSEYISIGGGRDYGTEDKFDDLYKYSIQNNSWQKVNQILAIPTYYDFYAAKENQSYFVKGISFDDAKIMFEYNGNEYIRNPIDLLRRYRPSGVYFFNDNKFYFVTGRSITVFDIISKNWSLFEDVIPQAHAVRGLFIIENTMFFIAKNIDYDNDSFLYKISLDNL